MSDPDTPGTANPIDVHVGRKVRARRKQMGLSQDALAKEIALTFQQVQKYERGLNRISASKLYAIGKVLNMPVDEFFAGLADRLNGDPISNTEQGIYAFVATAEGLELAASFPRIRDARQRRKVLELVQSLASRSA